MRRLPLAVFLLGALLLASPGVAHADDPPNAQPPQPAPQPDIDYLGLLARMQDELSYFVGTVPWPGHDNALAYIWKVHVQKRSKRAQRFFKELQKTNRWEMDADDERAYRLKSGSWSPFVQRLAKAYSELAAARDGLGRINVSPKSAISNWHKLNPEPDLRKATPAELALTNIRAAIARYRRAGKVVPRWYYIREAELIEEALAERRALEAAHAAWIVEREAAIERINAAVIETRKAADVEAQRIELFLRNVQALVAELQLKEEAVLRAALASYPDDERLAKAAKKDLKDMAKGRKAGARYDTKKSSKWSSLVRQGWMRPHGHLTSALKSAKARAAKAAEEAAGDTPKAPEDDG
ncbi:MAG: hypothetical protein QNJ98_02350 [Planctomycetota bacterium]|nr:hypothetical protein [Planctomycetota bacterium]